MHCGNTATWIASSSMRIHIPVLPGSGTLALEVLGGHATSARISKTRLLPSNMGTLAIYVPYVGRQTEPTSGLATPSRACKARSYITDMSVDTCGYATCIVYHADAWAAGRPASDAGPDFEITECPMAWLHVSHAHTGSPEHASFAAAFSNRRLRHRPQH